MSGVSNFMNSPLVTWVATFNPGAEELTFQDLCDGLYLLTVFKQIDPRAATDNIVLNVEDVKDRLNNFDILMKNIKAYYQDVLQQYIVMRLPNIVSISKEPDSVESLDELKKVLLLVLGCAVQCERKETIVEGIKELDVQTQHAIVENIKEITDDNRNVCAIDSDMADTKALYNHLRILSSERDMYIDEIKELTQNLDLTANKMPLSPPISPDKHHLGVELAECKAKLRRLRSEAEDKAEMMAEMKDELEEHRSSLTKLRSENLELTQDARAARAYRDELDVLKEKATKVDKYEMDIKKYKEKINELEFFKTRVEELREDNRIMLETKTMLDEQLQSSYKRIETVIELENELMKYKQQLEEMNQERDADRLRIQELVEERASMEFNIRSTLNESAHLESELHDAKIQKPAGSIAEQLNDTSNAKLLKLELENQRLQKNLDDLKDNSIVENNAQLLELEKENQRLAKKVEKLQNSSSKETQNFVALEQQNIDLSRDKENLLQTMDTIKESADRQLREFEIENEQLQQTVQTLRERNEKTLDLRMKDIEKENKRLHENVRDMSSQMSKLEFDNRQLQKQQYKLENNVEKLKDLENENQKLDRENNELHKTVSTLRLTCERVEELEQENSDFEVQNHKLDKMVENLKNSLRKMENVEEENINLTVENQKLNRTIETIKSSSGKVLELESEKQALNHENEQLKKMIEHSKKEQVKYAKMEVEVIELDNENQKLAKNIEIVERKAKQLEKENHDIENENQKLQKSYETLKHSVRKYDELERRHTELEIEYNTLNRDIASLEKENKRNKQTLEVKDASIDEYSAHLAEFERENRNLKKTLEKSKTSDNKLKDAEKDHKELLQQSAIDKKTLTTLREDLVNEKIKTQQLNNDLDALNSELDKMGLSRQRLITAAQEEDESRFKALESMMEDAFKKSTELKEEKIHALESRLEESKSRNTDLQNELRIVKREFEKLKQRHDEEVNSLRQEHSSLQKAQQRNRTSSVELRVQPSMNIPHAQPHTNATHSTTHVMPQPVQQITHVLPQPVEQMPAKEILALKDHLVDLERENATLLSENKSIRGQLQELKQQISTSGSSQTTLQSQVITLSTQNDSLQSQNAKLQVEMTTLQSQSSSLSSQNSHLQERYDNLEGDHEQLIMNHEELQGAHESLVSDHEALQQLHEQLTGEYEALISEHGGLKSLHKSLKQEFKDLQEAQEKLTRNNNEVNKLRDQLEGERRSMKTETKSMGNMQTEYNQLKDENSRLKSSNDKLNGEYRDLLKEHKGVKSEYNGLRLRHTELQGDMAECKDQLNTMDVEVAKMANKCEALVNLNTKLEDDNRALIMQVQALLNQNQELLLQTLESKDQFHEEEIVLRDKLSDLKRQKEKLEEKIMDSYKNITSPKKNRSFGSNLVRKARGFITKRRRDRKSNLGLNGSIDNLHHISDSSSMGSAGDTYDGGFNRRKQEREDRENRRQSSSELIDSPKLARQSRKLAASTTALNVIQRSMGEETFSLRAAKSSEDLTFDSPRSNKLTPRTSRSDVTGFTLSSTPRGAMTSRSEGHHGDVDSLSSSNTSQQLDYSGRSVGRGNTPGSNQKPTPDLLKREKGFPRHNSQSSEDNIPTRDIGPGISQSHSRDSSIDSSTNKMNYSQHTPQKTTINNRSHEFSPGSEVIDLLTFLNETDREPDERKKFLDTKSKSSMNLSLSSSLGTTPVSTYNKGPATRNIYDGPRGYESLPRKTRRAPPIPVQRSTTVSEFNHPPHVSRVIQPAKSDMDISKISHVSELSMHPHNNNSNNNSHRQGSPQGAALSLSSRNISPILNNTRDLKTSTPKVNNGSPNYTVRSWADRQREQGIMEAPESPARPVRDSVNEYNRRSSVEDVGVSPRLRSQHSIDSATDTSLRNGGSPVQYTRSPRKETPSVERERSNRLNNEPEVDQQFSTSVSKLTKNFEDSVQKSQSSPVPPPRRLRDGRSPARTLEHTPNTTPRDTTNPSTTHISRKDDTPRSRSGRSSTPPRPNMDQKDPSKPNSVWYEYGCV
ncbi:unnamed protein product [Owenia fusiformis]|uniref:Uncharacterized protein n=1 Tax=Owenia fusiformis TaxID=6347 RepID=A0A8J1XW10_OWEFU|nr:unnamed protein product [Owenia fusiformis]